MRIRDEGQQIGAPTTTTTTTNFKLQPQWPPPLGPPQPLSALLEQLLASDTCCRRRQVSILCRANFLPAAGMQAAVGASGRRAAKGVLCVRARAKP